ncbi:MAG TPA: transposase [Thermoanaerobaculia bacterium]|nr:transposase [Thermoanaerobaculia bacterium]
MVEVTCRTVHGRYLLRPSRNLNEIAVGILARAKRMFNMKICSLIFTSSHYHMILWVKDAEQLANFMGYVNSNLAREAGRLVQWREKFWSRRYRAIVISDEEGAQIERMKYVLSNGAKEGLVRTPEDCQESMAFATFSTASPWRDIGSTAPRSTPLVNGARTSTVSATPRLRP